jgi:hypothetical protein
MIDEGEVDEPVEAEALAESEAELLALAEAPADELLADPELDAESLDVAEPLSPAELLGCGAPVRLSTAAPARLLVTEVSLSSAVPLLTMTSCREALLPAW